MLTLGLSAALGGVPALTLWSALALLTGAALLSYENEYNKKIFTAKF